MTAPPTGALPTGAPRPADHPAVYLDHAATTPMLASVATTMAEEFTRTGNASSLHAPGRRARRTVEEARERIGDAMGARASEVVFTAGGTESDNLAVKGLFWARRADDSGRTRVLASAVEHRAVLDTVRWLRDVAGADVDWLPVDRTGTVHPDTVADRIAADGGPDSVALVTCMWANNEVGAVQPIEEIADRAAAAGVPLHTDAVQAVGALPVDFAAVGGVHALSLSGHKLGGPVGAGALLLRRTTALVPLQHGGGQEREVRSGTLDVPAIAGLAVAVEAAVAGRAEHARRLATLRDQLVTQVRRIDPGVVVVGGELAPAGRLPGTAHLTFPGCEGDSLLLLLDAAGIACSTGSACSAGVPEPSHVLTAMGYDDELARGSLRFSLGRGSGPADVDRLVAVLPEVLDRARAAGVAARRRAVV